MQSRRKAGTLSKELLKLLRSDNNQYTMRGKKVKIYDAVLKILENNPDKNIGQLTSIIERHGIYSETFRDMINSFVLNNEIEVYNQGQKQFVRVLKSKEQTEPRKISDMAKIDVEEGVEVPCPKCKTKIPGYVKGKQIKCPGCGTVWE